MREGSMAPPLKDRVLRTLHRGLAAVLVQLGWNEDAYRLAAPHAWLLPSAYLRAGARRSRAEATSFTLER